MTNRPHREGAHSLQGMTIMKTALALFTVVALSHCTSYTALAVVAVATIVTLIVRMSHDTNAAAEEQGSN